MFEFALKIVVCRRHIFTIFYTLGREAESTHSECKQQMEIVPISAGVSESIGEAASFYCGAP